MLPSAEGEVGAGTDWGGGCIRGIHLADVQTEERAGPLVWHMTWFANFWGPDPKRGL